MEKQVPIAVHKDLMDGEASGSTITFRPARYPIGGGDANDYGSWYEDSGDSAIGDSHWRMSLPGGNTYPSSAFDRLVYSYRNPTQDCGGDALDVLVKSKVSGSVEYYSNPKNTSPPKCTCKRGVQWVQGMQPTLNSGTKTAIFPTHCNQ